MKCVRVFVIVVVFISLSLGLLAINTYAESKGVVVIPLTDTVTKTVTAGIKVYDKNSQYLGILINADPRFGIFIPELKAAVELDITTGHIVSANLFFVSTNCTGTAYVGTPYIFRSPDGVGGYRYYKPILEGLDLNYKSVKYGSDGFCGQDDDWDLAFEIVEITEGDIPINLPVALPLRLE